MKKKSNIDWFGSIEKPGLKGVACILIGLGLVLVPPLLFLSRPDILLQLFETTPYTIGFMFGMMAVGIFCILAGFLFIGVKTTVSANRRGAKLVNFLSNRGKK